MSMGGSFTAGYLVQRLGARVRRGQLDVQPVSWPDADSLVLFTRGLFLGTPDPRGGDDGDDALPLTVFRLFRLEWQVHVLASHGGGWWWCRGCRFGAISPTTTARGGSYPRPEQMGRDAPC